MASAYFRREGRKVNVEAGLENGLHQAFHHLHDIVFCDEGHLHVNLSELLAVGPQVLIAETFDNLKIAVKTPTPSEAV